jgi:hypothetical protein
MHSLHESEVTECNKSSQAISHAKTDSLSKVSENICAFIKVSSTPKMMGQNSIFTLLIA